MSFNRVSQSKGAFWLATGCLVKWVDSKSQEKYQEIGSPNTGIKIYIIFGDSCSTVRKKSNGWTKWEQKFVNFCSHFLRSFNVHIICSSSLIIHEIMTVFGNLVFISMDLCDIISLLYCLFLFSLFSLSFGFDWKDIKHSRQCSEKFSDTSKFVKNLPLRVVFLTQLAVFRNMAKHGLSCIY